MTNPIKNFIQSIFAFMLVLIIYSGCKKDTFQEVIGVCPVVNSTSPDNGEVSVALNKVITVVFNERMNPTTLNSNSFVLISINDSSNTVINGTISYDDATFTMSFVPSTPLINNTTYIGRVKTLVKDVNGNALQTDYLWTFGTGLTLVPTVLNTDPADNQLNVPFNKVIVVNFSVPMDAATVNETSLIISNGVNPISGIVNYSSSVAVFIPSSPLLPNTVYSGKVTTAVTDVHGIAMPSQYNWTFTTADITVPIILSTDPFSLQNNVVLNKNIRVQFNEFMDQSTFSNSSFYVMEGLNVIGGTISFAGKTAIFNPTNDFTAGLIYTATVKNLVKSSGGINLASDSTWSFTAGTEIAPTVLSTDPTDLASSVPFNKIIAATFSTAMDPLTLDANSIMLSDGSINLTGVINYNANTVTFSPNAILLANTTYTVTISTAAKNLAGVSLENDYSWSFSTNSVGVDLQSVARFGIISGVGVSNDAGASEIRNLDVGISPGLRSSITGFPPGLIVNGAMYASDDINPPGIAAMLIQAKQDLTDAYLFAEAASSPAPATVAGDIGGTTLAPGIYKSTSTLLVQSGNLTLDAQGDPNAVWIFQISSDLTTVGGAGGNIILSGGAQAKNIFWQTGRSATIGDFTSFKGNVLALTSITLNSGATAEGRMLAINGAVVMTSTNIISKP